MAYLEVSAFKKIRAFFWALQKSGFNLNKIPLRDNEGTPVDKTYCLNLLRSFPDFQGEEFKDDNFLIKYLSKPGNLKQILDQFTPAQQIELTKALEEKPMVVVGEQPSTEIAPAEQGIPAQPVGEATATMGLPGLPAAPSISSPVPRRIFITEQTTPPSSGKAGGTGQGTAASSKATRLTAKEEVPATIASKKLPNTPVDAVSKEATQPARGIRGGGTVRLPYQATNAAKNVGSSAKIFTKKAGNRLMGGLSNILGGMGRAGGSMLGGAIGGGGRFLGRVGLGGVDALGNFSNQISRGGLKIKGPSSRVWAGALIGFLALVLISGAISIATPEQQPKVVAQPLASGQITTPQIGNYTPGGGSGIISCPVNSGKVVYGSKEAGGHCSPSYGFVCQPGSGRDTAVDVEGPEKTVYLPYVQGNQTIWTIDESGTPIADFEGGGIAVAATTSAGGKSYRIRLVHLTSTTLSKGQQSPQATLVGQYNGNANHVHVTLQEDGVYKPADLYFKLCSK